MIRYLWQIPLVVILTAIILVFTPVGFLFRAASLAMLRGSDMFDKLVDKLAK